jgi:hypothetical protein
MQALPRDNFSHIQVLLPLGERYFEPIRLSCHQFGLVIHIFTDFFRRARQGENNFFCFYNEKVIPKCYTENKNTILFGYLLIIF